MEKDDLKNFIKKSLKIGHNKEDIKKALRKIGENSNDIDQAFKEIGEIPPSTSSFDAEVKEPIIKEPNAIPAPSPVFQEKAQEKYSPYSIKRKPQKAFNISKKTIIIILVSFVCALIAGASFYAYKSLVKENPLSFLPQDSLIYIRINTDPSSQQVRSFKALLQKFPNYSLFADKINDFLNKFKKENSIPENMSFNIAREVTFGIEQAPNQTTSSSMIVVLSNLDLKKANKLKKFLKSQITKEENTKPKEEKYRGKIISRYFSKLSNPKKIEETDIITIKNNLILADKEATAKKVIDSYLDHKNIASLPSYKKLKAKIVGNHLATGYIRLDLASLLETTDNLQAKTPSENLSPLFSASLKSIFSSLKSKIKPNKTEAKSIAMFAVSADEKGLKSEAYYLNSEMKDILPSSFILDNGLLAGMPQKIGTKNIVYYGEWKDLDSQTKKLLKNNSAIYSKDFLKSFEKDIFPLLKNNYAVFVASEPSGKETPIIGFIAKIDNENKVKEELLKIKIPKELTEPISTSLKQSHFRARDAKAEADLIQMRTIAELIYSDKTSYGSLSCNNRDYPQSKFLCSDIKENSGDFPVIHVSKNNYCAYIKLNEPGAYFCIDSSGRALKTYFNPGYRNYCNGITFNCPENQGSKSKNVLPSQVKQTEMVGFTKKIINGQEIYSIPFISKDLSISFATKNKTLFFVLGKNNLIDTINSYFGSNAKLQASKGFKDLFIDAPKKINGLGYVYPYGYLGLIKYGINFFADIYTQPMTQEDKSFSGLSQAMLEMYLAPVYEFIDKGIGPYLKMLKSSGSYAYLTKDGIIIEKSRIFIQELPAQEKKDCEDFWQNFGSFFQQSKGMLSF